MRYLNIVKAITAMMMTNATAPIAIPTFAPVDSELPALPLELLESGDELLERLEEGEDEEAVVVAGEESDEVDEVDEVGVGELVDTMAPKPFNTIPRFSAQQGGSLSQQKLPSSHTATRGRNPELGAGTSQRIVSCHLADINSSHRSGISVHRSRSKGNLRRSAQ